MPNLNAVHLCGHLTRDCETRYIPSGTAVCELGLAVNRRVKRGDQWEDKPVFIDCTCWGKSAEFMGQYARKGAPVLVTGELDLDTWDDKTTGAKRSKIKVQVQQVQLLGKRSAEDQRPANSESYGEESQTGGTTPDPVFPSDDVPF